MTTVLVVPEDGVRAVLAAALAVYGAGLPPVALVARAEDGPPEGTVMALPAGRFRIGAVLDRLRGGAEPAEPFLAVGGGGLDLRQMVWRAPEDGREVRLTGKEAEILALLHRAGGVAVARGALLETVWGYGDGVETHTVETHMYRLRQKIERDPARPVWLLTEGDGYLLVTGR